MMDARVKPAHDNLCLFSLRDLFPTNKAWAYDA
jgi:hypothetical protein